MSKRKQLPLGIKTFDPEPSFIAATTILDSTGVPYALAGRLAVWFYVSPRQQEFTKDIDFAVPYGYSEQAAQVAEEMGYKVTKLSLGYAIQGKNINIDFIDHHPHLETLFLDAVKAAEIETPKDEVPVVPIDYLITMKIGGGRRKDHDDIKRLLAHINEDQYSDLRLLVQKYLKYVGVLTLDRLAREMGHPGPLPEDWR